MLTYPLNKESGWSLYEQLYEGIRRDILSGTLPAHQRLPFQAGAGPASGGQHHHRAECL